MSRKVLCFRPTRNMHESGFRYIEYGYMNGDNDMENVEIVSRYDLLTTPYDETIPCNIDLTKSGWFRILPRLDKEYEWGYGGSIVATKSGQSLKEQP
jgi:hypothetical protein